MVEFILSEPALIIAVAVIIALAAWIFVRGTWSAWNNFGLLCFFVVMTAMSGWIADQSRDWGDQTISFVLMGFTALMLFGAITSLIALIREDPLG
jgi:ABC-type Fe3+-siderophore transport system permease subunit